MRHHAQHVAAFAADAGNIIERSVGISRRCNLAISSAIAEHDAVFLIQSRQRLLVAKVIAFHLPMGMRSTSRCAQALVNAVLVLSTRTCTNLQIYFSPALRMSAPGSRPASQRIWKPLQMPSTRPP